MTAALVCFEPTCRERYPVPDESPELARRGPAGSFEANGLVTVAAGNGAGSANGCRRTPGTRRLNHIHFKNNGFLAHLKVLLQENTAIWRRRVAGETVAPTKVARAKTWADGLAGIFG